MPYAIGKQGPVMISKVVVTGGGCAGKTTFLSIACEEAKSHGWTVLTIPETATLVMQNGVRPQERIPFDEYERTIMEIQVAFERSFMKTAESMEGSKPVLILCDRGLPDIAAYMDNRQYQTVLARLGLTPDEAKNSYDAVIHLVSVSDGAAELYDTTNNIERYETVEVALRQEMRIRECWDGFNRMWRIPAYPDSFQAKMDAATTALGEALGWTNP